MWSSPYPTKTLKIHLQVKGFTQNSRRPQTFKRARKSPCNWVGQKKEKRKESRWEPDPLKGGCEGGKVPAPGKGPL